MNRKNWYYRFTIAALSVMLVNVLLTFEGSLFAQTPQGFNYQAVVRNTDDNPLAQTALTVRIGILSGSAAGPLVWGEEHNVVTNDFGLFSIVIGDSEATDIPGTVNTIDEIEWGSTTYFLKIEVSNGGPFTHMGTTQLLSVPYSLFAGAVEQPAKKLYILGDSVPEDEALFEVKNEDNQTVFAVYPGGVRVYVEDEPGKGTKGGFAIGGFSASKDVTNEYFVVTPDSIRLLIDESESKGTKGGFAVGGFTSSKGINPLLTVNPASTARIINPSRPAMIWYPKKEAFLVGRVLIESPDSVGANSIATGFEAKAVGNWSQSFGFRTRAAGVNSTAIGLFSDARGNNSLAFGKGAKTLADDSYAMGNGAVASGVGAYAFGSIGRDESGNSLGKPASAEGDYSFAIGLNTLAQGLGSFAVGNGAISTNPFSFALGWSAQSNGIGAVSIGHSSLSTGLGSISIGRSTIASEQYAVAIGDNSMASGINSLSIGYRSYADKLGSMAIGVCDTATGMYALAIGRETKARGMGSTSFGYKTVAGADVSMAGGEESVATGYAALSLGYFNQATGPSCIAIGSLNVASGTSATALGALNQATGNYSTAFGTYTIASGLKSTAMGAYASTNNNKGSFVYGDASTNTLVSNTAENQFMVRAAGGTVIYSESTATTGVELAAGDGGWSTISDRNKKENFQSLDGEETLLKISEIPVQSWNYKSQDPSIRHIGPVAQDFFEAFSTGKDNLTISTIDIDGVNMLAIQALEKRTRILSEENEQLKETIEQLKNNEKELEDLKAEVEALKRLLKD